jgi:hypothetical protein
MQQYFVFILMYTNLTIIHEVWCNIFLILYSLMWQPICFTCSLFNFSYLDIFIFVISSHYALSEYTFLIMIHFSLTHSLTPTMRLSVQYFCWLQYVIRRHIRIGGLKGTSHVAAEWLSFPLLIRKVPGLNLYSEISYSDCVLSSSLQINADILV